MAYTKEEREALQDSLCDWIMNKGLLTQWVRIEGHPGFGTIYKWADEDRNFGERFARARAIQAHRIAETVAEVPELVADNARAANLMAGYKWFASKVNPFYNDKMVQDITSSDGALKQLSNEEIESKIRRILERADKRRLAYSEAPKVIDVTPGEDGSDLV